MNRTLHPWPAEQSIKLSLSIVLSLWSYISYSCLFKRWVQKPFWYADSEHHLHMILLFCVHRIWLVLVPEGMALEMFILIYINNILIHINKQVHISVSFTLMGIADKAHCSTGSVHDLYPLGKQGMERREGKENALSVGWPFGRCLRKCGMTA